VPTVLVAITAFGPSLDADLRSPEALQTVIGAMAEAIGINPAYISIPRVDYVLSLLIGLPGLNVTDSGRVRAAVTNITRSEARGTIVQVFAMNMHSNRRRLQQQQAYAEALVMVSNTDMSAVAEFNATVVLAAANGTLTVAMLAAGVPTTSATVAAPPSTGAQFHFAIRCAPLPGVVSGVPDTTAVLQAVSPDGLYSINGFLADLSAAGLGTINSIIVSQAAIAGAFSLCFEAILLVL
jgi:hypothetical protein